MNLIKSLVISTKGLEKNSIILSKAVLSISDDKNIYVKKLSNELLRAWNMYSNGYDSDCTLYFDNDTEKTLIYESIKRRLNPLGSNNIFTYAISFYIDDNIKVAAIMYGDIRGGKKIQIIDIGIKLDNRLPLFLVVDEKEENVFRRIGITNYLNFVDIDVPLHRKIKIY